MNQRPWSPERLVGERVILRRHAPANLAMFKRWYADPEVSRLTRYQDGPMRPDEIERFFAARVIGADSFTMAVHIRDNDRLIGSCAFSQLDPDNGSALYHITIGEKDTWGMGYGTDATNVMIEHAFTRLNLHRVSLSVFAFNERAIRAYRKAGFVVEGRAREAIWRDGRYWDELTMSILDHEWRAWRARRAGRVEGGSANEPGGQTRPGEFDARRPAETGREFDGGRRAETGRQSGTAGTWNERTAATRDPRAGNPVR